MLQPSMGRAKTAIIHRLSPKMSIVHPWMICFDLPMPHEVFDLLNKEILGLTRFGIDTPGSVTITFSNLRRLSYLYDQFQDCGGFRKQLGKGKREAKLIVNSEKKEIMVYNAKEQIVPPLTLVVINVSKNYNFSNFSPFLEKLQFLLDTLLPPVDLINFSKNCDFSHFFAIFGEIVEIAEVAVFAGHPSTSCTT